MQKVVQLLRVPQFIDLKTSYRSLLILVFSLLLALHASSQESAAKKVTLNLRGTTIKGALQSLEKQSGMTFIYGEDINKYVAVKLTFDAKDIFLKDAIAMVLKNTNLRYSITGDHILIDEKPAPKSPNVQAGGGPGAIKGRVVEFETSQPLPGATVRLVELNRGAATTMDGYYSFGNVPAGKYTLQVTFISFKTENVSIEIKAGKESTYDVKLQGDNGNKLNEVKISGTRKTRAPVAHTTDRQLVEQLKAAQSVVSGISSEQISKSADRNAAEVVRKIAGVTVRDDKFIIIRGLNERYNLTYLNGNIAPSTELYSRAFSLDLIPTRIIDRILVYKSPAPDLLADMTGGAVKIFTKDAKNVKHFDIELQTGYRENTTFNNNFLTYKGGSTDWLGFDDGTRKLPSSVPGYGDFTKANISQATYAKTFNPILQYQRKTGTPTVQLTANYYNTFKLADHSLSSLTSFSYKNEPVHTDVNRIQSSYDNSLLDQRVGSESQNTETAQLSLLQNFTYHLRDSSSLQFKNFVLQQGQNAIILRDQRTGQIHVNNGWQDINQSAMQSSSQGLRDIILSYTQRFLYSGNLTGTHYWGKGGKNLLEWNGGYTYSRLSIPDQRAIHLQNDVYNPKVNNVGEYEQNWIPVFRAENPLDNNSNAVDLGMISRIWIQNTEQVYNGSVDYTYKLLPWVTVKAGTYQQWKQRVVYRRVYTLNEGDLPASGYPDPLNAAIGATNPDMDLNLVFFHQQDLGKVWSTQYLRDNGSALKVFDRTSGSDAYNATEQNNSGYAAISLLPFNGKVDIYGGLRVEYNRQKVAGALSPNASQGTGGINTPVLADLKTTKYLPSINISIRPDSSIVVRGAYGKTVNRPEFRELAPYSELDYINNQNIRGNPQLLSATVNNYDARLEWYPRANAKGESISFGGFYKEIDHPIERVVSRELNNKGAADISFFNADRAVIKGIELDIRKTFDFIPLKFFRDLSFIANGSYIYSRATRKGDTVSTGSIYNPNFDRQLQGQSPYSVNIGLYYENAGSGTKVAVIGNQVGPRIYAAAVGRPVGAQGGFDVGTQGSLIELERRQLDFSLTQRLLKSFQAKLSIQNLLDDPIQIAEDSNFTYKYEKAVFTPSKDPNSKGDAIQGDLLYSSYKLGRFYLLTLTYSF